MTVPSAFDGEIVAVKLSGWQLDALADADSVRDVLATEFTGVDAVRVGYAEHSATDALIVWLPGDNLETCTEALAFPAANRAETGKGAPSTRMVTLMGVLGAADKVTVAVKDSSLDTVPGAEMVSVGAPTV